MILERAVGAYTPPIILYVSSDNSRSLCNILIVLATLSSTLASSGKLINQRHV